MWDLGASRSFNFGSLLPSPENVSEDEGCCIGVVVGCRDQLVVMGRYEGALDQFLREKNPNGQTDWQLRPVQQQTDLGAVSL